MNLGPDSAPSRGGFLSNDLTFLRLNFSSGKTVMLIVISQSPYKDQMSYSHLIGMNCVRWDHFGKLGKGCMGTSEYYYLFNFL